VIKRSHEQSFRMSKLVKEGKVGKKNNSNKKINKKEKGI
jgi:hypothetical protein